MFFEEEEKPISESDGLEDYWKDFALAVESTKLMKQKMRKKWTMKGWRERAAIMTYGFMKIWAMYAVSAESDSEEK
ncbi:hypothetical protein EJB05_08798, partial [Eragrostis curvula]